MLLKDKTTPENRTISLNAEHICCQKVKWKCFSAPSNGNKVRNSSSFQTSSKCEQKHDSSFFSFLRIRHLSCQLHIFRDFIRCPNLILKHPLPFLTMKANSRSPRHYKKLKSDTWQPWERLWVLLISGIKGSHPWPRMNMFPQTQSFSLSSQHSSAFSLRSGCFSLSHLLWSSFSDPIFLYWY